MKNHRKQAKRARGASLFALLLLLLALLLLLRWRLAAPQAQEPSPAVSPVATPQRSFAVETAPLPTPRWTPDPTLEAPRGYTASTYQLVSDLVFTRRQLGEDGDEKVQTLLEKLKAEDPRLGKAWEGIMDCWRWVNREMPILNAQVPQNLPEDSSLCFVVLGFQLQFDGTMAPQLLGRCEAALACARRYPNSLLALTGGGTAVGAPNVTEAGAMADWFAAQGIARERLIVEGRSFSTEQNASYTSEILTRDYPQITTLVIVTSDYHVPLGVLMFSEAALLYEYENGSKPFTVAANVAFPTSATESDWTFWGEKNQGHYVWSLAAPTIGAR